MENNELITRIEEGLDYRFQNPSLLGCALTHSSFAHEQNHATSCAESLDHYERFEFLGDAVLSTAVSDLIMKKFAAADEGELSRIRSGLVNCDRLAELARGLDLGSALRVGRGEEGTGGRDKPSILAAALEAVIAAVYLDGGFAAAFQMVERLFRPLIEGLPAEDLLGDYKSPLQEKIQARFKTTPYYRVIAEVGPDHLKTFEVELYVNGKPFARGQGRSKKEAEQDAARNALDSGELEDK